MIVIHLYQKIVSLFFNILFYFDFFIVRFDSHLLVANKIRSLFATSEIYNIYEILNKCILKIGYQ